MTTHLGQQPFQNFRLRPLVALVTITAMLSTAVPSRSSSSGRVASDIPSLSSYQNNLLLDPKYELYWTADTSVAAPKVNFAIRAATKGFVAFGISEVGGMVGSDAVVAWVSNGLVTITDRFIFSRKQDGSGVRLDMQQDWVAVGGEESVNGSTGETWTTIHFWRYLDTGDVNDRPILSGRLMQTVWSYGTYDQVSYHGIASRGSQPITFIPPAGAPTVPLADPPEQYLSLTFNNLHVPNKFTTYMCKKFELPVSQGVQIVSYEALLQGTKTSAVHHLVLVSCSLKAFNAAPDAEWSCLNYEYMCFDIIAAWAVGGKPVVLPAQAGISLNSTVKYLILQMHYTNPERASDIIDSSGVSLGVTTKLRPHEAGIMALGPVYDSLQIRVPARRRSWSQRTICPSACTEPTIGSNSLFIISSFMHMHTIGAQLRTEVIRGGKVAFTIGRQDYYDFNYQQMIPVSPPLEILPGDSLETTCGWDSSRRNKVTHGGTSTQQEMCTHYMLYYPKERVPYFGQCFDACSRHVLPLPQLKTLDFPVAALKGRLGKLYHVCPAGVVTANKTCVSEGYGRGGPAKHLAGSKSRSFCSTCYALLHSNVSGHTAHLTADSQGSM